MNSLILFLFGVLFAIVIFPILQLIIDVTYAFTEVIKAKIGLIVTTYNVEIDKVKNETGQVTHAIGFSIDEDYDEEDCFEDKLKSNKTKGNSI